MLSNDAVDDDQSLVSAPSRGVEILNAAPVHLQTLDLARNIAVAPDGKRYVVATYDDMRIHKWFVSAVYPQQNGYLTLLRLKVGQLTSETHEQALQLHKALIQAVQQGTLDVFMRSHKK